MWVCPHDHPPCVPRRFSFSVVYAGLFGRCGKAWWWHPLREQQTEFAPASAPGQPEQQQPSYAEIEPFTISPTISSTYTFARNPKHETDMVFVQRIEFPTLIHFYIFDLLNGLHHGHAPSQCQNCGHYFLTTNAHVPKYCDGMAPQDSRMTCRQYGAMMHQKEQNKHHPIYSLFSTRTGTIRKHHQRGKISNELRQEVLHLAAVYRDKALMDNDYATHGYAQDMELEALYSQAQQRLERGKQP